MIQEQLSGKKTQLHLCDFDGTLTYGDSLSQFLLFAIPIRGLIWGGIRLLFGFAGLLFQGKWTNEAGKALLFSVYFKGKSETELRALGAQFSHEKIPAMLRPELLKKLQNAHNEGATVVMVSASVDIYLQPFCTAQGFELLCTRLEFLDGKFSGAFATPNCKGPEKARRIRATYALDSFQKVSAYGNSAGDLEMFKLADEVFKF